MLLWNDGHFFDGSPLGISDAHEKESAWSFLFVGNLNVVIGKKRQPQETVFVYKIKIFGLRNQPHDFQGNL